MLEEIVSTWFIQSCQVGQAMVLTELALGSGWLDCGRHEWRRGRYHDGILLRLPILATISWHLWGWSVQVVLRGDSGRRWGWGWGPCLEEEAGLGIRWLCQRWGCLTLSLLCQAVSIIWGILPESKQNYINTISQYINGSSKLWEDNIRDIYCWTILMKKKLFYFRSLGY